MIFQLVAYTPLIIFLVVWFLVPESPRWLLAVDRKDEAVDIIRKGAKVNNRSVPEQVLGNSERTGGMGFDVKGEVGIISHYRFLSRSTCKH